MSLSIASPPLIDTQRLTSIDEQIKTKAVKNTLVMLTSVTKNASNEFNRTRVFSLLR